NLQLQIFQISIDECIQSLTHIKTCHNPLEKPTYLQRLPIDLNDGCFKGHHSVSKLHCETEFTGVKNKFIDAVIGNIKQRFPETDFLCYFSFLALRPVTFLDDDGLADWGNSEIKSLAEFYGTEQSHSFKDPETNLQKTVISEPLIDKEETMTEWLTLKKIVKAQQYPRPSMASLWSLICQYHSEQFPNLRRLAAIALGHPIHTADCERSFSSQNLVTTKLRCRLSGEHIDELMRVMLEGPCLQNFDFASALTDWRNAKCRIIFNK
ncbi:uncharacterized protein LOC134255715, partial [Saccostrea cucullata]|uniref:uncharacterized protein LOC134255715 n=1 Tax=Saccostrea cuccullata TaxID=36930 RepID=UPI002ED39946